LPLHFVPKPVGLRGLLIAGIFATLWLLSTAINAPGDGFHARLVRAVHQPTINAEQSLRAVRWATVWFSILMIIVASTTSYLSIVHPTCASSQSYSDIRLHVRVASRRFLCGMFTKRRGNDLGNIIAMIVGFIVVMILSGLPNKIAGLLGGKLYTQRVGCGNGIPLVDLLRHHRHVFRGDCVPNRPGTSPPSET